MNTRSFLHLAPTRTVTTPPGYATRHCVLVSFALPGLPHCHTLCHEPADPLPAAQQAALLAFFIAEAERLARAAVGDPEAYVLLHNGAGIARRPNWHAHVFIARHRWQKAWIHAILGVKNAVSCAIPSAFASAFPVPGRAGDAPARH